ncbi:ParB N-terminal domain-containing protein [Anaerolineales bacterium HSG24]|nr:ParB N-terminal domain-containing protein [Anaerolineales bacterium HSG24]
MARRKINIQRNLGARTAAPDKPPDAIDQLTSSMATVDIGFEPTEQRVYKVNLDRIFPDSNQPRHLMPSDLRKRLIDKTATPAELVRELLDRATKDDPVALLVLGGKGDEVTTEDDENVEERGLFALANSICEVGLRQPLNVYQIDDPNQPTQTRYRIGEGERRFWAHHILVHQGQDAFKSVRCIIESLPESSEIIYQRQAAENAARVDLPAIARARSMQRIKEQLIVEHNKTSDEKALSQRALQTAIGQQVKIFTGRAVGDRMVRNYLTLLKLSSESQDLAEAGELTEKQLRPIVRLKTDFEQQMMIKEIIAKKWSSRQVAQQVTPSKPTPPVTLQEVAKTTVEQRFEQRIINAAKTVSSLMSLPTENYDMVVNTLASRAKDEKTHEALQALHDALRAILLKADDLVKRQYLELSITVIIPPLTELTQYLPSNKQSVIQSDKLSGAEILAQLIDWHEADVVFSSRMHPFFKELETTADALRAGETLPRPLAQQTDNDEKRYLLKSGGYLYWAHLLLVQRGQMQFKTIMVELETVSSADQF